MVHVSDTLRADPYMVNAENVWQAISKPTTTHQISISTPRGLLMSLWINSNLKRSDHEVAVQYDRMCSVPVPALIMQLWQQCELTEAQKQERYARSRRHEDEPGYSKQSYHKIGPKEDISSVKAVNHWEITDPQPSVNRMPLWYHQIRPRLITLASKNTHLRVLWCLKAQSAESDVSTATDPRI